MDFNIGDIIKDEKRDLTITDKAYFTQGNRRAWYYKYRCNVCGYGCEGGYLGGVLKKAAWFSKQQLGEKQSGCPCCTHKLIVPHINSIRTTNQELSKYFMNNEDIKYAVYSGERVDLRCPFCGTIKENMVISSLARQGFACPVCHDKISIGERIIYYILNYFGLNFKKEFMFENNQWRYDFNIFDYNSIIEVHGEQHYRQTSFGVLSEIQQNDAAKKIYALDQGIEKYIVINAMKSDYDYIVNSILNSELSMLCDLSLIDWAELRKTMFEHSIVKDICTYWETHKDVSYIDMERIFSFSESTIRKYLKIGYKLGWCHKDKRNEVVLTSHNHNDSTPILYVPLNIFFKSIGLCLRVSEGLFGKRIPSSTIRYKIKRSDKEFKYITKEEFNNAIANGERCYGIPFEQALLQTV